MCHALLAYCITRWRRWWRWLKLRRSQWHPCQPWSHGSSQASGRSCSAQRRKSSCPSCKRVSSTCFQDMHRRHHALLTPEIHISFLTGCTSGCGYNEWVIAAWTPSLHKVFNCPSHLHCLCRNRAPAANVRHTPSTTHTNAPVVPRPHHVQHVTPGPSSLQQEIEASAAAAAAQASAARVAAAAAAAEELRRSK